MTDSHDLTKVAVAGQMSGHQRTGLGILEDKKRSGRQHSPIKKRLTLVFFSIVRHASNQLRMPAPRGMSSQHLVWKKMLLLHKNYFNIMEIICCLNMNAKFY